MKRKTDPQAVATALHSASIRLLRRLRQVDVEMGVGTARASVLSILVFGGPKAIGELAEMEQVRPPTMTRLIDRLEAAGLVARRESPADRRSVLVTATEAGRRTLEAGRARRVARLVRDLRNLPPGEIETLGRAAKILVRLQG